MQELIDFLRGCPEGFYHTNGLCGNVYEITTTDEQCIAFDKAMDTVVETWEYYSGNLVYPIAGSKDAYAAAVCDRTMYEGEYGRRRIELANLIADELEKQLCKSS